MKLVRFLQLFFRISNNGLGQRAFYPRHQLLATRHSFFASSCASSRQMLDPRLWMLVSRLPRPRLHPASKRLRTSRSNVPESLASAQA